MAAALTEVFRQAAESRIIVNAHSINHGLMPEWVQDPASDFHFMECGDADDGVAKILQIVRERIPARYGLGPICDIQVLCPMNRGSVAEYRFAASSSASFSRGSNYNQSVWK